MRRAREKPHALRRVPPQEGLEDARVEVGRRLVEGVSDAVWRKFLGHVVPQKHAQRFHIRTNRPRAHARRVAAAQRIDEVVLFSDSEDGDDVLLEEEGAARLVRLGYLLEGVQQLRDVPSSRKAAKPPANMEWSMAFASYK